MADDVDAPHDDSIQVADSSVASVVRGIVARRYLASIAGGKATWILRRTESGSPLAVIAQQWDQARYLVAETDSVHPDDATGKLHVYVEYYCQVEPDAIYNALQQGLPLPDRYSG
ncbi:MAG: hypothetical protein AAGG48_32210 [Planctomycetota bacterium]